MRAAGIDLGQVRVGVAVADELGLLAHPRPFLDGRATDDLLEDLARLAIDEKIEIFIVGLPRGLRGQEGRPARRAREFAAKLADRTKLPVELIDEWFTTVEARARLHQQGLTDRQARSRIDSAAAAVLLQSWLDSQRERDE